MLCCYLVAGLGCEEERTLWPPASAPVPRFRGPWPASGFLVSGKCLGWPSDSTAMSSPVTKPKEARYEL